MTNSVVHSVDDFPVSVQLQTLLYKYANTVFEPGLGKASKCTAQLTLKPDSQPKACKLRTIQYALQPKIEAALAKMEEEGSIEKVEHSEWATPIVPLIKPDGTVRVCGDYKVTLNPCLQVPQYPMPRAEECFHAMNVGERLTWHKRTTKSCWMTSR